MTAEWSWEMKKVNVRVTENQEWFVDVPVPAHLSKEEDIIAHLQEHESWIYDDMVHKNIDRDIWAEVMPQKAAPTEQTRKKYNSVMCLPFTVDHDRQDADDITASMLRQAISRKLAEISDTELLQACWWGNLDTMENEEMGQ
tara:strand:- start:60 stop:485 length:426 start_codon:yes stop_codon:yes gene_type:complete